MTRGSHPARHAGDVFKARAFRNVAASLQGHPDPITSGKQATKLPKIGKGSAAYVSALFHPPPHPFPITPPHLAPLSQFVVVTISAVDLRLCLRSSSCNGCLPASLLCPPTAVLCPRGSVQIDEFLTTGKVEALDPEVIEKQKVGLPGFSIRTSRLAWHHDRAPASQPCQSARRAALASVPVPQAIPILANIHQMLCAVDSLRGRRRGAPWETYCPLCTRPAVPLLLAVIMAHLLAFRCRRRAKRRPRWRRRAKPAAQPSRSSKAGSLGFYKCGLFQAL